MNRKSMEIEQTRLFVYSRDFFICQHPDCNVTGYENLELGHRIAKTQANLKHIIHFWWNQYKEDITMRTVRKIVNHPLNLATSCRKHNPYFNIGFKPVERDFLLQEIYEEL